MLTFYFPSQDLNSIAPVGYVEEVQMWELGQKLYLAVATTYRTGTDEPKVRFPGA